METMKKCLRSVNKLSTGSYEYFRVDVEEARIMVETGNYIYISREEFKRQSKFYKYIPCEGTLINRTDANGEKYQECLYNQNPLKHKEGFPSSTKIAKCSMNIPTVRRKNKYAIRFKR